MAAPEDAKLLIADAAAEFPTITGALTDDGMKRIREFLTNLLQSIDIAGGNGSLSSLINEPSAYQSKFGHAFDCLKVTLIPHDLSIPNDATNTVRVKAERAWTAKLKLYRLIRTVEHQLCIFFSAIVKETWFLPLKDTATFFNKVPIRAYLDHLATSSGGLEAMENVHLQAAMLG